jgi:hypothetical protein
MAPYRRSSGCRVTDVCQYAGILPQLAEHNPVHGTYRTTPTTVRSV